MGDFEKIQNDTKEEKNETFTSTKHETWDSQEDKYNYRMRRGDQDVENDIQQNEWDAEYLMRAHLGEPLDIFNQVWVTPSHLLLSNSEYKTLIFQIEKNLEKKYWLTDITYTKRWIEKSCSGFKNIYELSPAQILKQLKMIEEELGKYPIDVIKNSWLSRIVLTRWHQFSFSSSSTDIDTSLWYYDWWYALIIWSDKNDRAALHHEFFHLIDNKKQGRKTGGKNLLESDDKNREKIWANPQSWIWEALWPSYFLSYENQAYLADHLIMKPDEILQKAKDNEIIRTKIEVLTWCKLKSNFTWFERTYTNNEYKKKFQKYWFAKKGYYAKYTTMDHNRRNKRIGEKKWVQENGNAIRTKEKMRNEGRKILNYDLKYLLKNINEYRIPKIQKWDSANLSDEGLIAYRDINKQIINYMFIMFNSNGFLSSEEIVKIFYDTKYYGEWESMTTILNKTKTIYFPRDNQGTLYQHLVDLWYSVDYKEIGWFIKNFDSFF